MIKLIIWVVLISILGLAGLSGCDNVLFGDCTDAMKAEARSPDGRYVATVFERDCGATTDFSTHVGIRKNDKLMMFSEQVSVLTIKGRETVDVEWSTDETLLISLPKAKTFTKLQAWRDVKIVYH